MDIIIWALGIITTSLIAFLVWVAKGLNDIKVSMAVINTKLGAGDEKHNEFRVWLTKHDEQIAALQTDTAILKSKGQQ